jgi:hypothetical protein
MRIFRPLQIGDRVDFLAIPAAHLRAGVAAGQGIEPLRREELVEQVVAALIIEPGIHLPVVEHERHGSRQRVGRILAPEIVRRSVAHLDRTGGGCVGGLKAGHDFSGGKDLDVEISIRRLAHIIGHRLGGTENGVERLRKRRRASPGNFRRRLCDGRRRQNRCSGNPRAGGAGAFHE